ncbi:MAG: diaminohydroxyphosphoribosylaminopyrimidine deaminase [Candidatus Tokpelaia sp. JSC189]|nr:MAG: diaminohydroxyphosphoribosylaminopyrimidine deaminase [Candidatus Tokpelaia sp. JSC189]
MSILQDCQHNDDRFMAAAIRFARYNLGRTAENPSVGALIIRDDGAGPYIVGRGMTAFGGRPHAETEALAEACLLARDSTMYVTLEPCSHFGMVPPCVDALVAAGVKRVVISAGDPDPRVNGSGIKCLRQAGIEVTEHVLADVAREGLSAYFCRKRLQRPEITLKLAISADGYIGRENEGGVAVSGVISRAQVHILRAENDAILVGIDTVVMDDPMLDCRLSGMEVRSPIRIILDSQLRLPLDCNLVKTAKQYPVWVACNEAVCSGCMKSLESAGCRIIPCKGEERGIDLQDLLIQLTQMKINSLLVEGGAKVATSFWKNNLVDRLILFQSPLLIGTGGYKAPDFREHIAKYKKTGVQKFGEDCSIQWERVA